MFVTIKNYSINTNDLMIMIRVELDDQTNEEWVKSNMHGNGGDVKILIVSRRERNNEGLFYETSGYEVCKSKQ